MSPQLIKLLVGVAIVLSLCSWALLERSGKLAAQKEVVVVQGKLDLSEERVREQNRGMTALGNATVAANARADVLKTLRDEKNVPLVASIARLEAQLAAKPAEGKDCRDALREWRNGQ